MDKEIEIRECETLEQLAGCVDLQRDVFALPEVELSPVRHFVVTKNGARDEVMLTSEDQFQEILAKEFGAGFSRDNNR